MQGVVEVNVTVAGIPCDLVDELPLQPTYYDNDNQIINDNTEWTIRCKLPAGQVSNVADIELLVPLQHVSGPQPTRNYPSR